MLTFQISSKYLWSYTNIIDITPFTSIQEIIDIVLDNYNTFLVEYNLLDLKDLLAIKRKDFHIHDTTFEKLKELDKNYINETPIYICSHSHS